jgi:hypothetical protein
MYKFELFKFTDKSRIVIVYVDYFILFCLAQKVEECFDSNKFADIHYQCEWLKFNNIA